MFTLSVMSDLVQRTTLQTVCVFQAKETEIRGTRFVIAGLKTGGKYKFRVTAFNAAGKGEPGEVPEVLEVNDRTSESVSFTSTAVVSAVTPSRTHLSCLVGTSRP